MRSPHRRGSSIFNSESYKVDEGESEPLLQSSSSTKLYTRRWYILAAFSLTGIVDGIMWNTWGPLNQSAKAVYNWSNTELAVVINWGNIMYGLFIFVASYIMDTKGLRVAVVSSMGILVLGAGLRMVSMKPTPATWLNNVGQILLGIAGCVPYAGASLVSATWFPVNQRATATSIASMCCYIGDGLAFIIGPLIVKQLRWTKLTDSIHSNVSFSIGLPPPHNVSNTSDPYDVARQRKELFMLYLIEFGFAAGLFLMTLIYFPAKPPTAPSLSAATERMKYKDGLLALTKSSQFWLINAAFSPNGVFLGWTSVLGVILSAVGINQDEAGWIGFYMIVAGCVGGITVARFSDIFNRRVKLFVTTMYLVSAACLTWFTLMLVGYIPFTTVQIYISCIIVGLCLNGSFPLFMEMACESAYPVAEGITCGYLTMIHNTITSLVLAVLMIPGVGTQWMNWTLLAFVVLGIPFIFVYKADRQRSDRDDTRPVINDH
ncbi:solute carrier family 49 member 4 homolog [Liolophura sinensis]|uniref:solute carrier family 49 member 4 homolog n=1 Tax=Liolophura sinensis TaxID=3198878 RepID=UPI0031598CB0